VGEGGTVDILGNGQHDQVHQVLFPARPLAVVELHRGAHLVGDLFDCRVQPVVEPNQTRQVAVFVVLPHHGGCAWGVLHRPHAAASRMPDHQMCRLVGSSVFF